MTIVHSLFLAAALVVSSSAQAGPLSEALGQCLADSTSGKDRKEMARWVFIAMSVHPEIRELAHVNAQAKDRADQSMGRLVTRLLSENCASETRMAVEKEGPVALQTGFETLGKLAMQELMSNGEVSGSFAGFEKHVDQKKLVEAMSSKQR